MIRICLAGVTGWVGRSLVPAIQAAPDLELVGAVSRSEQGRTVGEALNLKGISLKISPTVEDALAVGTDVLVDYTAPASVKAHTQSAIARGVHVVIGTSGLSDADYHDLDNNARAKKVGVLAAGNFAIAAVLMQRFALA